MHCSTRMTLLVQLGKKQKYFESFYLWHSKGRNKMLKRLLLLKKSVKSWKSWKLFPGKRKSGGWKKTSCRWNWIFPTFTTNWNFDLHSLACLLGLCPWKFITGWRYNPNSMCLSILHSFTSQILTELKNVNIVLNQLQKTNASKRVNKDELPCWLNNKKKLATHIFLLHQFGVRLSHFLVLLIRLHVLL